MNHNNAYLYKNQLTTVNRRNIRAMNDNQEASDCVNTIVLFVNTGLRVFSETLMEQVLWTTFPFNVPPPLVDPRELGRQGRKAMADPGFPRLTNPNGRGAPQPIIWSNFLNLTSGGSRIFARGVRQLPKFLLFFKFLPKTAWKWKNLDPQGGGARPWRPPLDPPMLTEMYQAILYFFRNSLLKPLTKRNGWLSLDLRQCQSKTWCIQFNTFRPADSIFVKLNYLF